MVYDQYRPVDIEISLHGFNLVTYILTISKATPPPEWKLPH